MRMVTAVLESYENKLLGIHVSLRLPACFPGLLPVSLRLLPVAWPAACEPAALPTDIGAGGAAACGAACDVAVLLRSGCWVVNAAWLVCRGCIPQLPVWCCTRYCMLPSCPQETDVWVPVPRCPLPLPCCCTLPLQNRLREQLEGMEQTRVVWHMQLDHQR